MDGVIIQDLALSYKTATGEQVVLKSVQMVIPYGKICGLIGRTGAGKSSLIKALANFLPDNAIVRTRKIVFPNDTDQSIGIVLQNPFASLNPSLTIKKQFILTFGLIRYWKEKQKARNLFNELLKTVELSPYVLDKYPFQLSGGMCQRVNIALSLLTEPRLLILDEPTSALDAELRHGLIKTIVSMCKDKKIAVLIISHDLELIKEYSDLIYILQNGTTELLQADFPGVNLARNHSESFHNQEIILTLNNVSKSFQKKTVLNDVSFTLRKTECLGIVGRSGCGKSTIAKILCGIYQPDKGTVVFSDGCKIEMLFQDAASSLDPTMLVIDALNESRVISSQELVNEQQLKKWFSFFNLNESILWNSCGQLSGGQRQMIALMRILLDAPDIIILDEPTSSMDVFMQKQTLEFLEKLKKRSGISYILITHDETVVSYMCDTVLRLQ